MTTRASIVGASGYTGGEVLRLLLDHPRVEIAQALSHSRPGEFVCASHPNLRSRTRLQYADPSQLEPCDVLFLCLPHGHAAKDIDRYVSMARHVIDLSSDFRLGDAAAYERWYGQPHPAPAWLDRFVYGLPEIHRDRLRGTRLASGVGCNATAVNLALLPLAAAGLIRSVVCDLKVGSSEGGNSPNPGSHHPERAGAVRSYAPTGHRHQGEIRQELGAFDLHLSITAIEMVRGVVCTAHVFPTRPLDDRELWSLYRARYGGEPFVRIVKDRSGPYRLPEPKILAGSNYADVGFERDPDSDRIVVVSAIDNLMKGAAGSAVQCMNLMCGFEETAGLAFPGLHPI
ncbi:MAG: N-acetyl-gamma-glutamyl-phosphate reductase [Phycisphaeraceae bacterium]|nr:N-acetyl-gamma-glutamyl-phosphate reductase [Phycisphaeraceae bacterium]